MSDPATSPAGWYPDPRVPGALRFWDGAAWTASSAPATPPTPPSPPRSPGVDTNTVWIWLIVLLPIVPTLGLLLIPWHELFDLRGLGGDPAAIVAAEFRLFLSPVWWSVITAGYLVYGLNVWFAARDQRALAARGIADPFPWPWAFLNPVYPIGRSVVALRRTGRGAAPIWAVGAVVLTDLVVSGVITWLAVSAVLDSIPDLIRHGAAYR